MHATRASAATRRAPAFPARVAALRALCALVIVLASAEFLIATIGVQIQQLPARTDFGSYYLAGVLAREHVSPYDAAQLAARGRAIGLDYDQFPFLYPPPFALAMQPLAHLSYARARQIWMLIDALALGLALFVTARVVRRQATALGVQDPRSIWVLLAAFIAASLNST